MEEKPTPKTQENAAPEKVKKNRQISQSELPRVTLEQTVPIARILHQNAAGGFLTFDELAKLYGTSPKNTNTKYTIWGSEAYGLITSEKKGQYSMAETGRKIVAPTYLGEDKEAKAKAILTPTILSKFYSEYNKHPIPQDSFFLNMLETRMGIPRDRVAEARDLILENAHYAGILTSDGTINLEAPSGDFIAMSDKVDDSMDDLIIEELTSVDTKERYCFVICPIGEENSVERKHSDMLLRHLIEPVIAEEYKLRIVRADKIEKSGLITQQIFENLLKANLCIADLSFSNPNVFYELGIRHMSQLPSIQIIRKGDKIPFDVSHGRTIVIDTSDVYTLIDRIQSARKELSEYVKAILNNVTQEMVSDDNPVKVYMPGVKVTIPR